MKNRQKNAKSNFVISLLLIILSTMIISFTYVIGYNYEYVNVTSTVNVTNAYPIITRTVVDPNILLNAGTTKTIFCNASMYDWNGYADIITVNATFFDNNTNTSSSPDNNNSHYTNTSCTRTQGNSFYANYTCSFDVWYYANNASQWLCNITAIDAFNFTDSENNITTIQPYYALNVTPLIDYGNLAVGDISENKTANITNFGNRNINITVNGTDMICDVAGQIPVQYQKFSANTTSDYSSKTALSTSLQNINQLVVPKRLTTLDWNITYWQVQVPAIENPFGRCNGTIVFTAMMN